MSTPNFRASTVLLAAFALAACGQEGVELPPPVEQAASGLPAEAQAAAEAAAREFAADVRAGRADAVAERCDTGAFVDGIFSGVAVMRRVREDFRKGFETGLAERPGGLLADYLGQDLRFLRLVENDGHTQMLFRAWDEDDGLNYLRAAVSPAAGQPGEAGTEWRIVDLFSFTSGEWFTDSTRRTYLPLLVADAGGQLKRGGERQLMAEYELFQSVVAKMEEGAYESARRAFDRISADLRQARFARLLKLQILSRLEEEPDAYADALAAFRQSFPDDPALPLMMVEYHSIRGEHEELLAQVDKLEALLGGDLFLHFMRAGALSALGRGPEAVAGLRAAVAAEPEIEELRWALVHAALPAGENALVAEQLAALRDEFEFALDFEAMKSSEEYRDFAASEEGLEFFRGKERAE